MSDSRLCTAQEVADFLGISLSYVRHLSLRGEIAYIKVGRTVRYAATDIECWIQRRRVPSVAELRTKARTIIHN